MTGKFVFPILLGVIGTSILLALGFWQLQRLDEKLGILAEIDARLEALPTRLPETPSPDTARYQKVEAEGRLTGPEIHVLTSRKSDGPGFRVIRKLTTEDGRTVMVDLGFVREAEKDAARDESDIFIAGNLHWPDETDSYTPAPNLDRNIWFARDVELMAEHLGSDPVLVVARSTIPAQNVDPMPVTVAIPNNHLEYAITWFSLAAVWIGMTVYLLWRINRAQG